MPPLVLRDTSAENMQNSVKSLQYTFKEISNKVEHWTQKRKIGESERENQSIVPGDLPPKKFRKGKTETRR